MTTVPGRSILIVEDERVVAKDLQDTLSRLGYDVRANAASAEQAIAAAAERSPDLVLMDVRIKGRRDGIETAEILAREFGAGVVYLTAHADDATLERAKRTQPYGYLVKPVNGAELHSVIEIALYRREMEKRARERERWSSTALQSMTDAVIAVDLAGNVTYMNPVAEQLTSTTLPESAGRPVREVIRGVADGIQSGALPAQAFAPKATRSLEELTLSSPGGPRTVSSTGATPVLHEGRQLGSVLVLRDVTEQKLVQKQVELSDRFASLEAMAAGIAHEVNNSLAVVVANAAFVLEQLSETRAALEPLSRAAATVLRRIDDALQVEAELQVAADRIRHTMTDLKAFSRSVVAVSGRADVRRAIGWALRATAPELGGRARLATRLGELPLIRADEAQLGEVLARLLSNAAHSIVLAPVGVARDGAAHNEVAVSAQLDPDGSISISVRDSGPGMPAELQKHVFEPFFSSGLMRAGNGIGLAACHGFVRSLGGEIDVESALGKGTTFRIRLPASLRVPADPSPEPVQLAPGRRGRILVVDDNELVLGTLRRMLREHDVVLARDGVEALELLQREGPFDLVLSDVVMPRMTGIELYEELLAHHLEAARRMVFMSGGAVTAQAEDFLRAVPNRRIEKPFTSAQLSLLIEQCLSEGREPAAKHPSSGLEAR